MNHPVEKWLEHVPSPTPLRDVARKVGERLPSCAGILIFNAIYVPVTVAIILYTRTH